MTSRTSITGVPTASTLSRQQQAVLAQFDPAIAHQLIEFGKSLHLIDADILIFMARKSLCLYDVLLHLGIPPVQHTIISDRPLDMDLRYLHNKRIALVDDTLILGTTLAKTKTALEVQAHADVTVHVFCADTTWWRRDILCPDSITLELSDAQVMEFASSEVRALSLIPRPYLVDFPMYRTFALRSRHFGAFLSPDGWKSYKISTDLQEQHDVYVYTFFPNASTINEISSAIGGSLASCLELLKVRAFVRRFRGTYRVQIVPLVTLRPLAVAHLDLLFESFVDGIASASTYEMTRLKSSAITLRAKQRIIQYCMSLIIGERFLQSLRISTGLPPTITVDAIDADRHFGPWLHDDIAALGRHAFPSLWRPKPNTMSPLNIPIAPATLPASVAKWTEASMAGPVQLPPNDRTKPRQRRPLFVNLASDLAQLFLKLYETREIPARVEAQQLGARVVEAAPDESHNRERLELGLPWGSIVKELTSRYHIPKHTDIGNLLSLALDLCHDLGIAVPVTVEREGIVFRAYRHGEDVHFTTAELALAYETVAGVLDATRSATIPRLTLEKLLVLLIKVGSTNGFLKPFHGRSGTDGVARVGFHLKGAISKLSPPEDWSDNDVWLSEYLVQQGVLVTDNRRQYLLGSKTITTLSPKSVLEARELGYIVGLLLRGPSGSERALAPLDDDALIILTTCSSPRFAAGAMQAELQEFTRWFHRKGGPKLGRLKWDDRSSIDSCLYELQHGHGREAVRSLRQKYVAYRTGRHGQIVETCFQYLQRTYPVGLMGQRWQTYWQSISTMQAVGERAVFDGVTDNAAQLGWKIAVYLFAIEIGLRYQRSLLKGGTRHGMARQAVQPILRKMREYNAAMTSSGLKQPTVVTTVTQRLERFGERDVVVDPGKAVNAGISGIRRMLPTTITLIDAMAPLLEEFGKVVGRRDYSYLVWYDVIDSTAAIAGRSGLNIDEYRREVAEFKDAVNRLITRMSREVADELGEIFPWNGDASSTNDEKHIFLRGPRALRHVEQLVDALFTTAHVWPHVRIRVFATQCNFMGTPVYRGETDTEVKGRHFWEYWSRVKQGAKGYETRCANGESFLGVVSTDLARQIVRVMAGKWLRCEVVTMRPEIELLQRQIDVVVGAVGRR